MILRLTLLSALTMTGLVPASSANTQTSQAPPEPAFVAKQAPARPAPNKKPRVEYHPHTVLVKFRSASASARVLRTHGARKLSAIPDTGYVEVSSSASAPQLLAKLRKDKSVEDVSLNYLRRMDVAPNDPAYQQGYHRYLGTVRMPEAWSLARDARRQVVAVLDSGVDATHPDLVGKVVRGYNAVTPGGPTTDIDGHGTFVAGIIAANTNNRTGVSGVTWNGRVMPIRVFHGEVAYDSWILRGIVYAYSHGATVINMSLGGGGYNGSVRKAIQNANARGVVVVASAGNDGVEDLHYPASYPEVIAVGATDHSGNLTDFSTWGDWVDLTAPGWNITSTYRRGEYVTGWAGTSFSAPIVAGVTALLKARFPSLTPSQVVARLKATARDNGPRGIDPFYGHGFLDAYAALGGRWAHELPQNPLGEANDVPARATPVSLTSTARGTFIMEGDIDWYRFDTSTATSVTIQITPPAKVVGRPQNVDPVLVAYNSDLRYLRGVDAGDFGQPETVSLGVAPGTTYIAVYNYRYGARDGRLYTLTVRPGSGAAPTPGRQQWVRDAVPPDYAGGVALNAKPTVTFARTVEPVSVNTSTVRLLHGRTGAPVSSTVTYAADSKTATLTPHANLQDNTPYRISVRGVREGSETLGFELWSMFRTVNTAPGPVTGFDAVGSSPGAVRLGWRLPYITDLDQVVVRRAAGTTPPSSPTAGTAVPVTSSSGTIATGLTNGTSYAFSAWVRDRTGLYSPAAKTLMVGTRVGSAAAPTVVTYGQVVKLSAGLARVDTGAAVAGHSIFLHSRQHGTRTWQLVGRFTTNASGIASFSYKPSVGRDYVWTYYGSVDLVGSQSGIRAILVRPVITSNVSKPSVGLGGSVLFYGSVNPKHVGQLVFLQRWVGRWAHVTTTRLTSNSTYVFSIKPAVRGTYAYRAVRPADADHLVAISPTRTFRVT